MQIVSRRVNNIRELFHYLCPEKNEQRPILNYVRIRINKRPNFRYTRLRFNWCMDILIGSELAYVSLYWKSFILSGVGSCRIYFIYVMCALSVYLAIRGLFICFFVERKSSRSQSGDNFASHRRGLMRITMRRRTEDISVYIRMFVLSYKRKFHIHTNMKMCA